MDKKTLRIEYLPLDRLIPYARNARTHSAAQVAEIAGSMREFGWTNPVLIDGEDGIIAGHGRVLAARQLAMAEAPCIRLPHLTETQKRALVLADNKLALNAGWDDTLLKLELEELKGANFDLALTGFSAEEVSGLWLDDEDAGADGPYSRRIEAPIYEPTGEKPPVSALYDDAKTQQLLGEIRAAGLPPDLAAFLEKAAERHTAFHFARIAEFYAHAEPEVQRLMEASALVIIDFHAAIEGGFVQLTRRLGELAARQQAEAGEHA